MAHYPSSIGMIRIATATPKIKVADVDFNADEIIHISEEAEKNGCSFIVFPELAISGYTCADLFYNQKLIESTRIAVDRIAGKTKDLKITIIVGAAVQSFGKLYNCGIFINEGKIRGIIPKTHLVNTYEYYEERWFSSARDSAYDFVEWNGEKIPFGGDILFNPVNFPECKIGIEICEDLWTIKPPSLDMALAGANVIFNLSASDEYLGKKAYRMELVKGQSGRCFCAYIYSSSGPWESSTDLVFSGHSMIAENSKILNETERFNFESQFVFADIDINNLNNQRIKNNSYAYELPAKNFRHVDFKIKEQKVESIERFYDHAPFVPLDDAQRADNCREIFNLQTTGLARRLQHIGTDKIVLGLSGGLDSTLAFIVAIKTFEKLGYDKKGIYAITMPGFGTTGRTFENAKLLGELLGATLQVIPITDAVTQHFKDIGHDIALHDVVYENAQARERTQILMDYANKVNGIVLGTGDLSELALGWATYNGDHMSMYNVNSGIPKTLIRYIIEWVGEHEFDEQTGNILKDVADTPVSPELLPAGVDGDIVQKTESTIGPYALHDFFLYHFVRNNFKSEKIKILAINAFKEKFTEEEINKWLKIFIKRFFSNQFKRSCSPDGVKLGSVALSPRGDWKMPSDAISDLWLKDL